MMELIPGSKRWKRRSVIRSLITAGLICHGAVAVPVGMWNSGHRGFASQPKAHHPHLAARQLAVPRTWKTGAMEYASDLTWSPDGRRAAYTLSEFLAHTPQNPWDWDRLSLCSIRADVTGARRLYSEGSNVEIAGWSPNGQRVLFWQLIPHSGIRNADGSPLYDVAVQGGKPRLLTIPIRLQDGYIENDMMRKPENLAFSPDGKSLLLVCGGGRFSPLSNKRLCLLDYSSGKRRWLSSEDKAVTEMAWSPDGMRIVFAACPDWSPIGPSDDPHWREQDTDWRASHTHLWITDAHGRHLRRLTSDARYMEEDAKWLPVNKIIRFTRVDNAAASIGKESHWEIRADGTGLRCIDLMTAEAGASRQIARRRS